MATRKSYRITVSTSDNWSESKWLRSKRLARAFCRTAMELAPDQGYAQLGFQLVSRASAKDVPTIELGWLWAYKPKGFVVAYSFLKDGEDTPVLRVFEDEGRARENYDNVLKRCNATEVTVSDLRILHDGAQVWPKA